MLSEAAHGASTIRLIGYSGRHQSPDRFGLGVLPGCWPPIDGISRARPADDVRIENPDLKVQG
jgi:hypothetical protein